jgi:putative ABC transport system permease protein
VSYSYASYRTSNERWGFEFNNEDVSLHMEGVDENYLSTLGLELISGRDFRGIQDSGTILVNQEACRQYFGDNPEGTIIESLDGIEVIGVIKDFRFLTFDREVEPIGLMYRPSWLSICNIRLSGSEFSSAIKHMEEVWRRFCIGYPFEYHFVDQLYKNRYEKQKGVGELLMFFSVISVLIASLGIFGLATFTVVKRSKEVGIRKVNGSSIFEIVKLLSGDINRILLLAIIPAYTAIFIIMNRWLSGFAYHISMPWWIFIVAALTVWLVAILSTIGKTIRTARTNPAEVLRTE